MITFIAYASVVSLLLVAAATASEPLLRAIRQPTRSVWLAAVLGAAIAIVSLWAPHSSARSAAIGANTNGVRETGTTSVMPRLARDGLPLERRSSDAPVLARGTAPTSIRKAAAPRRGTLVAAGCWLVASFGCLAWLLDGMRRVRLLRRSCRAGLLCGERVLVSDSVGPAVLGVLRQWIVIPAWVEQLDEDARRLILAHEC